MASSAPNSNCKHKGLWIVSWHKLPGSPETPYMGQIVSEAGQYWILDVDGKHFRCLKGACSTVKR